MPDSEPNYGHFKPRDVAYIYHKRRRIYLPGAYNSARSKTAYQRVLLQIAAGLPIRPEGGEITKAPVVGDLVVRYLDYAHGYYPNGPRSTYKTLCRLMNWVLSRDGLSATPIAKFGPLDLKELQAAMVQGGLVRTTINGRVNKIRGMFKWGVSDQIVPVEIWQALCSVQGLRKGRTTEPAPRLPVDWKNVEPVLPHVSKVIGAMLTFQLYTGVRSGSLCKATRGQFTQDAKGWLWTPPHKTEHLGKVLVIPVGPRDGGDPGVFQPRGRKRLLIHPQRWRPGRPAL
jgi:integrase